mmetsp:Transcript_11362/g.42630  ORF Transcript_11362/g.42630 Transcript_11362/m.42630 type:complete len:261 (-) Transcript_11362:226-1008(-)
MTSPFYASLLASIIISLLSLVGIFIVNPTTKHQITKKSFNFETFFLAFAISSLLCDVLFHLMSHASSIGIFGGIILSFLLHLYLGESSSTPAILNIVSDGIHNFLDGASVAVAFMVSQRVGLITSISIMCHELPQEISDYYILRRAGWSKQKALVWNFASALLCVAGTMLGWRFITDEIKEHAVGITSGCFLYLILSEMMPDLAHELHVTKKIGGKNGYSQSKLLSSVIGFGVGCAVMYGAEFLEHAVEHWLVGHVHHIH